MLRGRRWGKLVGEEADDLPVLWQIVPLDQEPLRESAAEQCARALASLEDTRRDWHRFERKDRPAFNRWRAREFGALLSRARDLEEQIREKQQLIHEVEMEMRRGFYDAHSAYQRVIFRRENRSTMAEEETASSAKPSDRKALSDFEKEALFQEWVRKSLGTNPDKMDDVAYSTSFEAFKSHMFRHPPPHSPPLSNYRSQVDPRKGWEKEEPAAEQAVAVDGRVKELYRRLVRRLHPDSHGGQGVAASEFWHEVQEAYAASDVARLDLLLALTGIESTDLRGQTSLAQMHAILAELTRARRALEKSLLEAKGEDAWDFARIGPNETLKTRVQRELQSSYAARCARFDLLTRTIDLWAQGPIANRKATDRSQLAARR